MMGRPPKPPEDKVEAKIAGYMSKILDLLLDLHDVPEAEREFLDMYNTPARVAKMWVRETLSFPEVADMHITELKKGEVGDIVCVGPIGFASTCAHHLMPFMGHCWVSYLSDRRLLGLSKFTRVTKGLSKRPQLQEKLTRDVLEVLSEALNPRAMLVVMKASHGCVACRGVEDATQVTVTAAMEIRDGGFSGTASTRLTEELYRVVAMAGGPYQGIHT